MADLDVRQIRRRVGVTQADLAVMVGVTPPRRPRGRPGAGNRRASPPVRAFGLALATYPEA
jgi:predicted transcriptional regulator